MFGIFSKTTDSNFIEIAGIAGLDFIIIDQEHGNLNSERLPDHIRAAKITNLKSYVRVPFLNNNFISKALDSGADGIMIPNISNVKQALEVIEYSRFYPTGKRGVCRYVKSADFGNIDKYKYFNEENKKIIILQVEGAEGIANLNEILKIDGFDYIFIGPYDLSQSLGYPGDIFNELVLESINKIIHDCKEAGKKVGIFTDTQESVKIYKTLGVEMIAFSVDVNIYLMALKSIL